MLMSADASAVFVCGRRHENERRNATNIEATPIARLLVRVPIYVD